MTDRGRRVAALVAVFAPGRAGALLSGMPADDRAEALAAAAALASAPRRDRLRTLAGALSVDPAERRARAEAAAVTERPRIAALLRQLASDAACSPAASPALLRLCREVIGR